MTVGLNYRKENRMERYMLTRCREAGFMYLKFTSPSRGAVPDRVVITPAGTFWVELKAPGGKPDKRQLETHARMRRHGAQVFVIASRAEVENFITAVENEVALEPDTSSIPHQALKKRAS